MDNRTRSRGRFAALGLTAALMAATTYAQTIDVRSTRIALRNADVAAQVLAGSEVTPKAVRHQSTVAKFPTVVLGTVTYTMAGEAPVSTPVDTGERRVDAVDLLPAAFTGDSLANIPENSPGEPVAGGTVVGDFLPGTVTTDSLRFNVPLTSPLVGVAGPGSSPGIAGPGFVATQGAGPASRVPTGGVRVIGVPSTSSGSGSLMRPR